MSTVFEYVDLARRMERYPEEFRCDVSDADEDEGSEVEIGIAPGSVEWDLCIDALKQVAEHKNRSN